MLAKIFLKTDEGERVYGIDVRIIRQNRVARSLLVDGHAILLAWFYKHLKYILMPSLENLEHAAAG